MWEPVLVEPASVDRAEVERAAAAQGLPAIRWPEPWPFDSGLAMRAATYAKHGGRVVAYSMAAMRQAFVAGRDLSVPDNVLIAAAACELHPRAVLTGVETRAVAGGLREATAAAQARGVTAVPAVAVGERVLVGPDAPERAADLTSRDARPSP